MSVKKNLLFVGMLLLLAACSAPKKADSINNACAIMDTHKSWRKAFTNTHSKYGVPPHVIMAIIYYESHFVHDARPPRKKGFLFFKGDHISSAYGYAQALDGTWEHYKKATGQWGVDRDDLPDAVEFVGWYLKTNQRATGISLWDAKNQYLAYHEGTKGYLQKRHNKKPWLLKVANRVGSKANRFRQQLAGCYTFPQLN